MVNLSIVTSVYGQPQMLEQFMASLAGWPYELARQCEVVIVDDAGDPAVEPETLRVHPMGIQLLRVGTNIPWNQPGARNLGMKVAKAPVALMADPDMVFSPAMSKGFLDAAKKLKRGHVLMYALKHISDGRLNSTSPNTWIIHVKDFWDAKGYDEDYSGHKGWSDVQLMHILMDQYRVRKTIDLYCDFYTPKDGSGIQDSQVHSLPRCVKKNHQTHLHKRSAAARDGGWAKWAKKSITKHIRFPWKRLI